MQPVSNLRYSSGILFLVTLLSGGSSQGALTMLSQIELTAPGAHGGIAFDGDHWYIAQNLSGNYHVYDRNFLYTGETRSVSGFNDLRSITFDPNTGNLFVGDHRTGRVREISILGEQVSEFVSDIGNRLEGVAIDPRDSTLWLTGFNRVVEHRTRSGELISSFVSDYELAEVAVDTFNNTILVVEDDDSIIEYDFAGNHVATHLPGDQIEGNGLGIWYDSSTGDFYLTSQSGILTIFSDPSRIPEPTVPLLLLVSGLLLAMRRSRSGETG